VRISVGAPIDLGRTPASQRVSRQQMLAATEQVRVALADLVLKTVPDAESVPA
jgi:hypothetical protein